MKEKKPIIESFRKKERDRTGYRFISDERFEQLTINVRRRGAIIMRGGKEVEDHLDLHGAAASIIGNVLFFRKDVTVSEVIEEVYHYEQNLDGMNDDQEIKMRMLLNEIDAKKYIIANKKKYRIPRLEIEETKKQLEELQSELTKRRGDIYV